MTQLYSMADAREAYRRWDADPSVPKHRFRGHWVDRAVGAFRPGTMLLVGARTNVGKTQFTLELARHCDHRTVYVACEDAKEEVGRRVGHWSPKELEATHAAFPAYPKLEAVVDAVRAGHDQGCELAVVDYAQAVVVPGMTGMVAEATRHLCHELKGVARELGMCLVLASQVKRPQGDQRDAEPSLFDLRDGSSLENMSDVVVLLHAVDDVTLKAKVAKSKWSRTGQEQLYTREVDGRLVECTAPVMDEADEWT